VSVATFDISDNWTPTTDNINALPRPLRRYIHDLQTNADPAGTLRENFRLRRENAALRKGCETLANKKIDNALA
jgi:hypothetical protein